MVMVRALIVRQLMEAGYDGMSNAAAGTSGSEVTCALMNMALSAVVSAKEHGGDLEALREIIEKMYAELPPVVAH